MSTQQKKTKIGLDIMDVISLRMTSLISRSIFAPVSQTRLLHSLRVCSDAFTIKQCWLPAPDCSVCYLCMFSLCRTNTGEMNIAWVHSFVECCFRYVQLPFCIQDSIFGVQLFEQKEKWYFSSHDAFSYSVLITVTLKSVNLYICNIDVSVNRYLTWVS